MTVLVSTPPNAPMATRLPAGRPAPDAEAGRPALLAAAREMEATFLATMLKSAGVGEQRDGLTDGVGHGHFAVFQRRALAEEMVAAGGIGLAEQVFHALAERSDAR